LFLGVDHTAIVVGDTDQSLRLYHNALGMKVVGESENYDAEQEHLNNVFWRAIADHGRASDGRAGHRAARIPRAARRPRRARASRQRRCPLADDGDCRRPSRVNDLLRQRIFSLVSPNVISLSGDRLGFGAGILVRDVDGHGRRIASR
jgi:catechol 2,3-dioxygenase-like lactoylglutathione lyase family enzyme